MLQAVLKRLLSLVQF